jgi:RNA polymerase sigma-70 factor (ECF subfamily)
VRELQRWADERLLADRDQPRESFAVFYRRHVTAVLAFYARRGVPAQQAGDLTAETFAAALVGRRRYRPDRDSARPWLLTIAERKLVDSQRRLGRDQRLTRRLELERIPLDDDDRADYARLAAEDVAAALDALPASQRDAIRARVVEGRPYEEISTRLGIAEPAARKQVSRGLAALRARLKEDR